MTKFMFYILTLHEETKIVGMILLFAKINIITVDKELLRLI